MTFEILLGIDGIPYPLAVFGCTGMTLADRRDGGFEMKKILATVFCLFALILTAIPAGAQTRSRRISDQRIQTSRYNNDVYRSDRYRNEVNSDRRYNNNAYYDGYGYDNRSVWEKHRDKITTAGGAAAGALLGGLAGGGKGAIIGAIVGGGGAALYTYKIRDKYHR